jgi:hypothetical protein
MSSDPQYACEKLSLAIYELTVGEGDVRSRLRKASKYLSAIFENDFPPEFREDWIWIQTQLTKRRSKWEGTEYDEGSFNATIHGMRNSTGSEIAKRMVELESQLEAWLEEYG